MRARLHHGCLWQAQGLADALAALSAAVRADELPDVVAGATDIWPARTQRQAWFRGTPGPELDISNIEELRGIAIDARCIRIGALATWTDIAEAKLPPGFDALKQAARQVGGKQIQNRGTIGGNLCNASPAADGARLCWRSTPRSS